jgi:hypothetical protein
VCQSLTETARRLYVVGEGVPRHAEDELTLREAPTLRSDGTSASVFHQWHYHG